MLSLEFFIWSLDTLETMKDEIKIDRLETKVEVIEGKRDKLKASDTLYANSQGKRWWIFLECDSRWSEQDVPEVNPC